MSRTHCRSCGERLLVGRLALDRDHELQRPAAAERRRVVGHRVEGPGRAGGPAPRSAVRGCRPGYAASASGGVVGQLVEVEALRVGQVPQTEPSSSICCSAVYGIGVDHLEQRAAAAPAPSPRLPACSSAVAEPDHDDRATCAKWYSAGTNGAGGALMHGDARARWSAPSDPSDVAARSAGRAPPGPARRTASPRWTIGPTSCSRYSNSVTTPKLPPPPRSAQNRSGCSVGARPGRSGRRRARPRRDEVVDGQPVQPA